MKFTPTTINYENNPIPHFNNAFELVSAKPGVFPGEHYTTKDGLYFREVNDVFKANKDFLWIATAKGLNRFDGVNWEVFEHTDPPNNLAPNNNLQWITPDQEGNLLLVLKEGSTYCFNPGKNQFLPTPPSSAIIDSIKIIGEPFITSLGDILALGNISRQESFFLLKYTGKGKFEKVSRLRDSGHPEKPGWYSKLWSPIQLWGGTAEDFWYWDETSYIRFQPSQSSFTHYLFKNDPQINAVNQLLPIDKNGRFWFPNSHPESGQIFQSFALPAYIPLKDWDSYTFDNNQNIWIKEKNGKVFKYDFTFKHLEEKKAFDFKRYPLAKKILEDDEGTLWIPHKFGLAKVKKRRNYFEKYLHDPNQWEGLPQAGVETYSIVEDQRGILFLFSDKLYQIDPKTKIASVAPWYELTSSPPAGVYPDFGGYDCKVIVGSDGFLWINWGTGKGLYKYYPETGRYEHFAFPELKEPIKDYPHAIQEDDKYRLWLTDKQIYFFDRATETFSLASTSQYSPFGVLKKEGTKMWASTKTGIVKTNTLNDSLKFFGLFIDKNDPIPSEIFTIVPYRGKLWMGTKNGLLKYDPTTRHFMAYKTTDGLPHDIVYTILTDGDHLWMGTHQGLCKFNINTLAVKNYYVEDGLSHNEFNREAALKASDGKMYFGGMNGVNAFYPAVMDSLSKLIAPPLVWTGFSKLDYKMDDLISNSILQSDTLKTILGKHGDKSFTFHYALLSFSDPSENKYYHYLEGFDKSWIYDHNVSFINYPSLPPGKYTLRVKANDSNGNPGLNELAIPITIYGPWWLSWWVISLFAFLILGLFMAIRKYEIRRINDHAEALRLKELDGLKTKLYTNITHEFRTPLTVILGLTDNIKGHEQERNLISRNGKKLLLLINQILDLSKFDSGVMALDIQQSDIIKYLNYLTESFYSLAKEKEIRLLFYSETPVLLMDFDEVKMQHIVYNLLSNAIKFTSKGGKVILHARKIGSPTNSQLQLKVQDTGKGIPAENLPYIFDRFYQADSSDSRNEEGTGIGLTLTKEFVELMGGSISVSSTLAKGSEFTALLPIKNEAALMTPGEFKKEYAAKAILQHENTNKKTKNKFFQKTTISAANRPILLIVEDNKDVIAYIQTIIKKEYRIETALNGKTGQEKAIELIPDIIISDVMMPEMDGYTLTRKLKTDERTSHIPIILLTAKAREQDRITGLQSGADAYLAKPFNKTELLIRLDKLTQVRKAMQQRYANLDSESLTQDSPPTLEDAFLKRARQVVEENLEDAGFTVIHFCRALQMSQSQLYRKLMALTGKSPTLFIRSIRLRKAAELLRTTDLNISEIAWDTGFNDPNYFSRVFQKEFGKSPNEWRN